MSAEDGAHHVGDLTKGGVGAYGGSTGPDVKETLRLVGKVIECSPPRRLVLTWTFPADEVREERHSRFKFEIEPIENSVRLQIGNSFSLVATGRGIRPFLRLSAVSILASRPAETLRYPGVALVIM